MRRVVRAMVAGSHWGEGQRGSPGVLGVGRGGLVTPHSQRGRLCVIGLVPRVPPDVMLSSWLTVAAPRG